MVMIKLMVIRVVIVVTPVIVLMKNEYSNNN